MKLYLGYYLSVFSEDGELETMSFDSVEAYKKYITPHCAEDEVQQMVETFLRKREKKVYYEPLFDSAG